jgi:energy-coupling factor transporter ATP-binding protein EcfA2
MTTTPLTFTRAIKSAEKLRLALDGPTGSGKTWTALIIATWLAEKAGGRVALIDSERSSALKYAKHFDFDHLPLPDFSPHTYMAAVRAAEAGGYAVIVVDSFTHAWEGVLELKDNVTARSRSKNSYTEGWREATPVHNQLVDAVLRANAHVICTLRTKTEYVINDDKSISKVGLKPIQRDGVEYEFDVVADMDQQNTLLVSKTRCPELHEAVIRKPDERFAQTLWDWLNDGEPAIPAPEAMRLTAAINAGGQAARAQWLTQFGGVKPAMLPVSRLAEADAFVATLVDFEAGPQQTPASTSPGAGEATDREAVDGRGAVADSPAPANAPQDPPGPHEPPSEDIADPVAPEGRQAPPHGLDARMVATKAGHTFRADIDAAPGGKGSKKKLVGDRLRHALVYAVTKGRTHSTAECEPMELHHVWWRLDDIGAGKLTYEADALDDAAGVTFTSQSGKGTTVLWSEFEVLNAEDAEQGQ